MRSSQILAALAVSLAASASAQNPQVTIPSGFLVIDSVGKEVGLVLGVRPHSDVSDYNLVSEVKVALIIDGTMLVAEVYETGFAVNWKDVLFTSTDCNGNPYLRMRSDFGDFGVIGGPAQTFFRPIGPPVDPGIPFQSMLSAGAGPECGLVSPPIRGALVPAERVVDLGSLFVPPFKLEPFSIDPAHCVRRRLARVN